MRNIFILLIALFTVSACSDSSSIALVKNQNSNFSIFSPSEDSLSSLASKELQSYLYKMTQASLPLVKEKTSEGSYVNLYITPTGDDAFDNALNGTKEDAFLIVVQDKQISIVANQPKGLLYGVYTFLNQNGIMLFSDGDEYVPENSDLNVPIGSRVFNPDFDFRMPSLYDQIDKKYEAWHRIENRKDVFGMYVHTFHKLIKPEDYYQEHPEYFALVNGKRNQEAQLCLTNDDLFEELVKNLEAEMEKKPHMKYWSVSQNDCINYCECENCKAEYEKYDSFSGLYIDFVNRVAERFPDKQISTLAYQFTRDAPKNIVPRDNVNIMFCSIECNRSMPFEDDPRSASFVKDMNDWAALTQNFYIWDYVVQFQNFLCPFPNFNILQPNVQFFKAHGADMLFSQGTSRNWSDFRDLKLYILSQLNWDTNVNVDSLKNVFFPAYYGPASGPMREYFELVHFYLDQVKDTTFLNIYGYPVTYASTFLSPDKMEEYMDLLDHAEQLAQDDSMSLMHVWKSRLAADFAYLDLALNRSLGEITYVKETGNGKELNDELMQRLDRLVDRAEHFGVNYINEKVFSIQDYKAYALGLIQKQMVVNKILDADVKLLTEPSPVYQVGEVDALSDGKFGGLHFKYNWLGFQGNDFICTLEFPQEESLRKLSMSYLTDVISWVFLPTSVRLYSVDKDGKETLLGEVHPKTFGPDRRIASIPVEFDLEGETYSKLKIVAESIKMCPEWHRGYGSPSWIFVDEVVVE